MSKNRDRNRQATQQNNQAGVVDEQNQAADVEAGVDTPASDLPPADQQDDIVDETGSGDQATNTEDAPVVGAGEPAVQPTKGAETASEGDQEASAQEPPASGPVDEQSQGNGTDVAAALDEAEALSDALADEIKDAPAGGGQEGEQPAENSEEKPVDDGTGAPEPAVDGDQPPVDEADAAHAELANKELEQLDTPSEDTPPVDTAGDNGQSEGNGDTPEQSSEGDEPPVEPVDTQAPEDSEDDAETDPADDVEDPLPPEDEDEEPVAVVPQDPYAVLDDETRNFDASAVAALREQLVADRKASNIDKEFFIGTLRKLASKVYVDVERWEDTSLIRWAESGQEPARVGKLLKHDRIRSRTAVERWSDDELIALITRKIEKSFNVDIAKASAELVRRRGLSSLLSPEQVRVWLETEVLPKSIHHESDLHQLKPAYYWSNREINDFIHGRLAATKAASEGDIYDEYRQRNELTKESYPDNRIQGLIGQADKGVKVHMAITILESELKSYAEKMAPSAQITEAGAGVAQTALYRQMTRTLALEGQDFVEGWTLILDFFQAHKDSHFDELRRLRGLANFQLGSRDRESFEQLVNLCVRTCDPKVRYEAAKNVNFGVVLAKITNESIRHRVLGYYRVGG